MCSRSPARININPVEGLQPALLTLLPGVTSAGQNQHQPSRGITTSTLRIFALGLLARININPVEGLQLVAKTFVRVGSRCQNQHQPSRGITTNRWAHTASTPSWPESTSTQSRDYNFAVVCSVPFLTIARININPVEGLQL